MFARFGVASLELSRTRLAIVARVAEAEKMRERDQYTTTGDYLPAIKKRKGRGIEVAKRSMEANVAG